MRDQGLPTAFCRVANINLDNLTARRLIVGFKIKTRAIIADEIVGRFQLRDQFHHLGAGFQIFIKEAVTRIGAFGNRQQQVATIIGYLGTKTPVLVVRALIDQLILTLRRAQAMVIELLVVVDPRQRPVALGFVITGVENALAAFIPAGGRKLDPVKGVSQLLAGGDIEKMPLLPVRARLRRAIGQHFAVT